MTDASAGVSAADPIEQMDEQTGAGAGSLGRMIAVTGPVALPLRGLLHVFPALRRPDYARVWTGSLLSNMGTWIQNVAKSWLVYEIAPPGQKTLWLGIDAFAGAFPTTLLLPLGGVLADRFDRRWILGISNALMAVFAILLAALFATGHLTVGQIVFVSVLNGICAAAMVPAIQSLLPQLVSHAELPNAVALNALQFNLSRAVGPAIGGYILAGVGAGWSFGLNALSFMAVIVAMTLLPRPAPTRRRESMLGSFVEGWRYLRSRPDLMVIETLVFSAGFCAAPAMAMVRAYDDDVFGKAADAATDARRFSMLLAGFGLGAVGGAALLAARSGRGPTPWRAIPIFAGFGVVMVLLGLPQSFALTLALFTLAGMSFIGAMNRMFAALLASTPAPIRGRLSSLHVLFFSTGLPVGSLYAGHLARTIGMPNVFVFYGVIMMLAVAGVYYFMRTRQVRYEGVEAAQAALPGEEPGA
ncbi:MAG: MFS transporter [Planctomycetota bacterium]|nr:MFS transporter [Planctomycetota bacterium]